MNDSLPEVFERVCAKSPEVAMPGLERGTAFWWYERSRISEELAAVMIEAACWWVLPNCCWSEEDGVFIVENMAKDCIVSSHQSLTIALLLAVEAA